jgi:hypothetical protein
MAIDICHFGDRGRASKWHSLEESSVPTRPARRGHRCSTSPEFTRSYADGTASYLIWSAEATRGNLDEEETTDWLRSACHSLFDGPVVHLPSRNGTIFAFTVQLAVHFTVPKRMGTVRGTIYWCSRFRPGRRLTWFWSDLG